MKSAPIQNFKRAPETRVLAFRGTPEAADYIKEALAGADIDSQVSELTNSKEWLALVLKPSHDEQDIMVISETVARRLAELDTPCFLRETVVGVRPNSQIMADLIRSYSNHYKLLNIKASVDKLASSISTGLENHSQSIDSITEALKGLTQ